MSSNTLYRVPIANTKYWRCDFQVRLERMTEVSIQILQQMCDNNKCPVTIGAVFASLLEGIHNQTHLFQYEQHFTDIYNYIRRILLSLDTLILSIYLVASAFCTAIFVQQYIYVKRYV